MSRVYAIILAGGRGLRMERDTPKQFLPLGDKPLLAWSLEAFNSLDEVNRIIVVSPEEYVTQLNSIIKKFRDTKIFKTVAAGSTRQCSVYNALVSQDYDDSDILVFHDAARPFIKQDVIRRCIHETREFGAAGVYVTSVDTIAEVKNGFVKSIPSRTGLFHTQTPQSFYYHIIRDAHEKARSRGQTDATDDVSLVVQAGYRVKKIEGDYENIKITTAGDFNFAGWLIKKLTAE